jgi:hypothetical protein
MLAGPRVGTFDRFWAPVLGSPMPVLICTGSSEFYDLSQRLLDTLEASPNDDSATLSIERSDLQRVGTRFVSLNDALALARVVGLLQKYDKTYQVRENRTASFADLRSSPVVLIGLFSNAWTLRLASDFRFAPAVDAMLRRVYIQDRQHPGQTDWHLKEPWPALAVARDFGLVSRVHDLATGNIVVIAAGITPYGTTAAIDLLTTPQLVEQALHQAPRDWADRNLQIVVETRVAQGTAGPPRVLATHFW